MRKVLLVSLVSLSLLLALIPACKAGGTGAALGEEVQLQPGQTVSISRQDLAIQFVKVNEDSRCPTGVM
jgi:hypothetical protein